MENMADSFEYVEHGSTIMKLYHDNPTEAARRINNILSPIDPNRRAHLVVMMRNTNDVKELGLDDDYFHVIFDRISER